MALPVQAADVDLYGRVEPAVALPLSAPQSDRFNPGFNGLVDGGIDLGWVDVKATAQLLVLIDKGTPTSQENAVAGAFGGGVRLKAPYALLPKVSPWLDADLLYVRGASLNRFGYSLAAGVHFTADAVRWFRFGPVVRFMQIVDTDQVHFDDRDAFLLTAGLSAEFDGKVRQGGGAHYESARTP